MTVGARWILPLALGLGACAARQAGGPAAPGQDAGRVAADAGVSLSLSLETSAAGQTERRPLPPGGALRLGDRYALRVALSRPARLTVLRCRPGAAAELLHPLAQTPPDATPSGEVRVPAEPGWWTAAGAPGLVLLRVLADAAPEVVAAQLRGLGCADAAEAPPISPKTEQDPPPPPPPEHNADRRKPDLVPLGPPRVEAAEITLRQVPGGAAIPP